MVETPNPVHDNHKSDIDKKINRLLFGRSVDGNNYGYINLVLKRARELERLQNLDQSVSYRLAYVIFEILDDQFPCDSENVEKRYAFLKLWDDRFPGVSGFDLSRAIDVLDREIQSTDVH